MSRLAHINSSKTKDAHTNEMETGQHKSDSIFTSGVGERIGIIIALFSLYIIWGSTYLGMRMALESFPPFIMGGIRFMIAGALLFIFLVLKGNPLPTRKEWMSATILGTLMLVGGNGLVSFAEQWVTSGITAVALAAVPLWTTLFVGVMGRWPKRLEIVGLVLGFLGVILLNLENGMWATPIGAIALLIAPICWSLGSALSLRLTLSAGLMASAAQMLTGGALQLATGLLLGERMHSFPSLQSIGVMSYLIIFGAIIGYSAYNYLLQRVRPSLATSYAYVNPIVAVLLGMVIVNEQITIVGILAMIIILTGVGLVSLKKNNTQQSYRENT